MKKRWLLLFSALLLLLAACAARPHAAPAAQDPLPALVLLPDPEPQQAQTPAAQPEVQQPDAPPPAAQPEAQQPETQPPAPAPAEAPSETPALPEDGSYTSRDDVALYLHLYGHLPGNFITKKQAEALGWSGGSLERYAPGKCIGGNRFGNYEGLLPNAEGRRWTECDVDTLGADSRGAKRIVFSNDGLIYYTEDHYRTFELLYGEE